jgi:D-hydroxyproline dehydrogenase subunit alpha
MIHRGNYDLAVVGGGPAGMAAAICAVRHGIKTCLIDEQPRLGGQIYRQPPRDFSVSAWLPGAAYAKGKALIAAAQAEQRIEHIAPATVWGCFRAGTAGGLHDLVFHDDRTAGRLSAKHVLIATGCYESPVAFPGWQLPGVMSAGAIQTLLKSQQVAAGRNIVLAGSHPLLLVVAQQLLAADVKIAALIFTQPLSAVLQLARSPRTALTGARQLLTSALMLMELRRAGVPVIFGHAVIEALGARELGAVSIRSLASGAIRQIDCDALGMCYGFLPSSELARQCGASHRWANEGGWITQTDEFMRTSTPGISVAGELTGVAGAEAAAVSGEIAALGVAVDLRRVSDADIQTRVRRLQRRLTRVRRFAKLLGEIAIPDAGLLANLAQDATLICRCEDVCRRQIEDAVRSDAGIVSASTVKLLTRAGMGYCQGRMCEINVRRIVANMRQLPLAQVPGFVIRPPIKPIPIALLASLPDALSIEPNTL